MMSGRFALLCAGVLSAAALLATRLDFVVAYDLSARAEGLPGTGATLTHTTTLLKGGAPLSTPAVVTRTWSGKTTQTFAAVVEADGAELADTVRHELTYAAAGGANVAWREERRLLPVPFASHVGVAEGGVAGNFALLSETAKGTARDIAVTTLQGISQSAAALTAQTVHLEEGGIRVQGGDGETPSLAAQFLAATGTVRLTGEGNAFPEGLSVGQGIAPEGAIIAWMGESSPGEGWALCDGTNGTPDLTGRFIVGTRPNGSYALAEAGGAKTVALTAETMPEHAHPAYVRVPKSPHYHFNTVSLKHGQSVWGRGTSTTEIATLNAAGGDGAHENLPPYCVVRFYMKKGGAK